MKKKPTIASAVSCLLLILAALFWPLLLVFGVAATCSATSTTTNWIVVALFAVVLNGIYLYFCYKDALVIVARREAAEHHD